MEKACGLDVHKESVFACILDEQGKKKFEKRYGTLTPDLIELRDTLVAYDCGRVAMESTSIYWMPIWHILESDFELTLTNPYFISQLPGRKSDATCLNHLEELANTHFVEEISLLCTIPGINTFSALCILAEIGNDMSAFPKATHLIGWSGLRPRNDETAQKIKSRKILHGNKYLRQTLVEVSWACVGSDKSFLGRKFNILSKRMLSQKALIAITRKILVIIYNVLKTKQPFDKNRNMQAVKA